MLLVGTANTASILAKSPYGSLMSVYERDSIFPLREVPFYGSHLPAAKEAEAQLAQEWGQPLHGIVGARCSSASMGVATLTRLTVGGIGGCSRRMGANRTCAAVIVLIFE